MKCIEENSECLDLLSKTLEVEQKQKKRLIEIGIEKENNIEVPNKNSILEEEEAQRKSLMDALLRTDTPSTGSVVKILTNIQGKFSK